MALPPENELLIHLLKTVQYRLGPILEGAPERYPDFSPYDGVRTPAQILNHIGDVLEFAARQLDPEFRTESAENWDAIRARFKTILSKLDSLFTESSVPEELRLRLVQGPLSDAITHVGQMSTIRRMAGSPVPGENFFVAELPEVEDV